MKIAADKNILFAKEAFSTLGGVELFDLKDIVNENLKDFDVLLVRSTVKVDEELLKDTKIKFVGNAVSGSDHVDTDYLYENQIGFFSAVGCNAKSVAEYVLTSIYAFCAQKNILPQNTTVGIIGVGHIGGRICEILKKLKIKTILNDPIIEKNGIGGFSTIDYLAENSDIITIHVPLTKSGENKTENLLNEDFFAKVKKDAFLIQASRGAVCDEKAMLEAIGRIQKPIIDVWADEPQINADLAKKSMFATAHIAGHSFDGKVNGTKIIYNACRSFFFEKAKFDFEKEIFEKIQNQTIKYQGSISDILLKCCPINDDSKNFEKILNEKNEEERKNIFKELRGNYRKRLEFNHYSIANVPSEIADELNALGFCVL